MVITVNHLKYRYPMTEVNALDDITFSVKKGEFIGVVGRNGAGKSTLCQALIGLVPHFYKGVYGGEVQIAGKLVKDTPTSELSDKIGLVFQNPFTQITGAKNTVYEEIAFGLENTGVKRVEMIERIDNVLHLFDLYPYRMQNPFDLSGGQMQRMAIASIIAMEPEVIILDEPTSQLDPEGSEEVFKSIQKLSKKGITIIMAEHKIEKIAAYSDRVILMDEGKIVDFDVPEKIFSKNDLLNYGIQPPAFTRICRELGIKNPQTNLYPTTLEQAYDLVVKHNEEN